MKRREFITLIGGAAGTWPLAARGQQTHGMRRISVVNIITATDPDASRIAALRGAKRTKRAILPYNWEQLKR